VRHQSLSQSGRLDYLRVAMKLVLFTALSLIVLAAVALAINL
jgi:hypothetical protein